MREPRPEAGNHAGTKKNDASPDLFRIPAQIRAAVHVGASVLRAAQCVFHHGA